MKEEWLTLRDHVRSLLRDGKRSNHDDFKLLFEVWGTEKITEIAKEILKEQKGKEQDE